MNAIHDRLPIIVGVGQVTNRIQRYEDAVSPLDLMERSSNVARGDAGPGSLPTADTVVAIPASGWDEGNMAGALADRLKLDAKRTIRCSGGGEAGVKMLSWLGEEILAGRTDSALLASTHVQRSVDLAAREGVELSWPGGDFGEPELAHADWKDATHPFEEAAGLQMPIQFYPLVENALRAWRGQSIEQHRLFMGEMFARFTAVAAGNPHAWFPTKRSATELVTATPENRMICFPYTKVLNAILSVDQSAAIVMMSVGEAKRQGIPDDQWVFWWGGGHKDEEAYLVSQRPNLAECPAMADSHFSALRNAQVTVDEIAAFDFYSCFPAPVEMACKVLGLSTTDERGLTVTGGLPYAGGPGSGYTNHSVAAMTELLRSRPDDIGMVTGNGMYVSKHSAAVLSAQPPRASQPRAATDGELPSHGMETTPLPLERRDGSGVVDSYTVIHDRSGAPVRGVVVGHYADGTRFVANTPDDLDFLTTFEQAEQVGTAGRVSVSDDRCRFEPA